MGRRHFMRLLLGFVFVGYYFISLQGQRISTLSDVHLRNYEAFLDREVREKKLPGYVSLVSHHGEIVHKHHGGRSSVDNQSPVEMNQLFYIQSMTKPIISTAFMMLYEEGHFQLDDQVSKYIPEIADMQVYTPVVVDNMETRYELQPLKQPIRIYHLLTHTAGFSHGLGDNEYDQKLFKLLYEETYNSIEERVQALLGYPLMGQPGEQWNYSASPDILSLLIEHFSGMTTEAFLSQRLFQPLEMYHTGYNVHDVDMDRLMSVHTYGKEGQLMVSEQQVGAQDVKIFGGANGLWSTAEDYMAFATFILQKGMYKGKRLMSRKTIELMTQDHVGDMFALPGYGFGLGWGVRVDVSDARKLGSVGSHFWSGAFNTYFFIDPQEELIGILMSQTWPFTPYYGDMMRQFLYSAIMD